MDQGETKRDGLFDTLRRLGATLVAVLENRLELLVVELQEERIRLINTVLLVAIVVALGLFTLTTAAIAVLIVVWNEYGVLGLFVASGIGLLGTVFSYWQLGLRLKNWPLLSGSLAELRKDCEWLKTRK